MLSIASLSPATTEVLCALGLQEHIILRDQFSDFPDSIKRVPALKGHQNIDINALLTLNPDIVFTSTVIQEQLANRIRTFDKSVVHHDPRTLADIYTVIRELGQIWQREAEAEALIMQMVQAFNAIKQKARLFSTHLKVYIEEWPNPPMASANWVPEVIRIAGGTPPNFAHSGELSQEFLVESLLDFDPDLIIISWCGAGTNVDKEILLQREDWRGLRAIKQGNVRVIHDSLLNRPGPRLVEGAQRIYGWMFEMLH